MPCRRSSSRALPGRRTTGSKTISSVPARPTVLVQAGDIVDIGNRHFEVLHLPGHSPGSIGLWEEATGTLFSGDAVYDGPLLDELPTSSITDYLATMARLRELPVRTSCMRAMIPASGATGWSSSAMPISSRRERAAA